MTCNHPMIFRIVTTIGTRYCVACRIEDAQRTKRNRSGWYPHKPRTWQP